FFFFLTLPPHPTSTLFPYTTLFRSFDLAPRPVRSPQLGRKNAVPDRVLMLAPPARRKQVRLYRDRAQAEIEQSGIDVENDALHLCPRREKSVDFVELDAVASTLMLRGIGVMPARRPVFTSARGRIRIIARKKKSLSDCVWLSVHRTDRSAHVVRRCLHMRQLECADVFAVRVVLHASLTIPRRVREIHARV